MRYSQNRVTSVSRAVAAAVVTIVLSVVWLASCGERPPEESSEARRAAKSGMPAKSVEASEAEPARVDKPPPPAEGTTPAEAPKKKWQPPRFTARQEERDDMVRAIRRYGLDDEAILKAMAAVPRHEFVPDELSRRAYADRPLAIGYGQTISQPYIVAEMTHQLKLTPESRVLEIGTGSGYQAAVLTEFTPQVYSIEIIKPLADAAKARLKRLGYDAIQGRMGDGYYGWPEKAPFDGIIVTCAAGQIPPPLIKQLAPGGRMVIPVGPAYATQSLILVQKDKDGTVRSRSLMGVAFVPLVRRDAPAK